MKKIVLASKSPRRRQLLTNLGVPFTVSPSSEVEAKVSGVDSNQMVEIIARRKAETVGTSLPMDEDFLVIGADTLVVLDGSILGKPENEDEAVVMLRQLSGQWHQVVTGVAVFDSGTGHTYTAHEVTAVKIRTLSAKEIECYVSTKEPLDKAGAYGIQDKGALLVERIHGCYFNVVGLPLVRLARLLSQCGVDLLKQGEGDRA